MKKFFEKILKKKQHKEPLFQIRRHIFEYEGGKKKRGRKNKRAFTRFKAQVSRFQINIILLRKILLGAMTTIVMGSLLLLVNLNVSAIDITRENSLIDIDESYRSLEFIRGRNIVGLQSDQILQRLQSSQSVIRDIRLQRNFPNQISIHVIPYEPLFQTEKGFIMDSGQLHTLTTRGFGDMNWLDIVGFEESLLDRRPDFSLDDLWYVKQLTEDLKDNIEGLDLQGKKYYIKERELHIIDGTGTIYLFDLTDSIEHQVEKLSIYFTERGRNFTQREMKYLDLRVPRGVFTCSLEISHQCLRNLENIYGSEVTQFTMAQEAEDKDDEAIPEE